MNKIKVGRNDDCPCGSGLKFKKCCEGLRPQGPSVRATSRQPQPPFQFQEISNDRLPPEVQVAARGFAARTPSLEHVTQYGHVRPQISCDFHGYRFVVIGGKLIYMPTEQFKFFTDVLLAYVPQLFGREWFDQEIAKAPDLRHPVMQWRVKGMTYMNAQPKFQDNTSCAVPTGPLLAYMNFAHDLYTVDDNARLDSRLIERLKHADQFQGARQELFAEATCLRAGFQIEHENETDGSARHAEFTATHKATGVKISVEVKSKHRPGVLGRAGVREPEDSLSLRFGKFLNDAVAKNAPHPLVLFMDVNMPFQSGYRLLSRRPPHPMILQAQDRLRKEHGGKDPISLLLFTNHPQHYTKDEELAQKSHWVAQISGCPVKPVPLNVLMDLANAINFSGNIPQFFPGTVGNAWASPSGSPPRLPNSTGIVNEGGRIRSYLHRR
jgi:hypothetical protein